MTAASEIRLVLANLVALQAGLVLTDNDLPNIGKLRAFTSFPSQTDTMPAPAWVNEPRMTQLRWSSGNDRHTFWEIRSQLFIENADLDRAVEIAMEFDEQFKVALEADMMLGRTLANTVSLAGDRPNFGILSWNGLSYGGSSYLLNVETEKAVVLAAP